MDSQKTTAEFIQKNSPGGGFLQSENWLKFQETVGRKTFRLENGTFGAGIVEHSLPIVGKYFYVPRGPVFLANKEIQAIKDGIRKMVELAKKENIGWIRIEPASQELLETIKKSISEKIAKAPHDMQPKEIFAVDISKPSEQLLAEMKPKTRYNIGVAQKKGVKIVSCGKKDMACMPLEMEFLRLTKEMAARQGISAHPEAYYRKMIEVLPSDMLRIYAAEYGGKTIAANLVLFFENTATYLHGASGSEYRNVMAPFLLHWQAILDAKEKGIASYDFGGVKTHSVSGSAQTKNDWSGITNFKLGFSPMTKTIEFPGSYDIIVNPRQYALYRGLQGAKALLGKIRK